MRKGLNKNLGLPSVLYTILHAVFDVTTGPLNAGVRIWQPPDDDVSLQAKGCACHQTSCNSNVTVNRQGDSSIIHC